MQQQKGSDIKVEVPDEIALGIYSNLTFLNVTGNEFIFDFGSIVPGQDTFKVQSRIIMSPQHAKRFSSLIQNSIKNYEDKFGNIPSIEEQPAPKPMGFAPPEKKQ